MFTKIEDLLRSSIKVEFKRELNYFYITLTNENIKDRCNYETVALPYDHLTEAKFVKYMDLMAEKLLKKED